MFLSKGINVLSLFDGMSCGRIALARSGIAVNTYHSSEIDKHAITVSKANWNNNHFGDVTKWREWLIDWASIDLILAGSPCQGFSFAGKQLAFDDPRSALFFVFIDILNHINSERMKANKTPVKFMLENVKMKKEHLAVISDLVGVEPVFINSALVSAQNRQRYYWCNWEVEQPEDKGILLKDIIDYGYVEKDKSWCVLESWNRFPKKTESAKGRYKRCMMPIVFDDEGCCFDYGWRELDIFEVEKLQTVPTGYCRSVADKVGKGLLGNGWTVDVIKHILDSSGLHHANT